MPNESYFTKLKIKIESLFDTVIDNICKISILKEKKKNRDQEIMSNIKKNSEIERKQLAKELGLPKNASWKKIVQENDKLIDKKRIYQML